jgi:hypothetical protein
MLLARHSNPIDRAGGVDRCAPLVQHPMPTAQGDAVMEGTTPLQSADPLKRQISIRGVARFSEVF